MSYNGNNHHSITACDSIYYVSSVCDIHLYGVVFQSGMGRKSCLVI